jgi:outer membrane protein W
MTRSSWLSLPALVAIVSVSPQANADESRWYVAGNLGFGDLASTSLTYSDGNTTESSDASFDLSFAGGASIGYRISERFSVEGELMYRRNEFDGVELGSLGTFSGGDFASLGIGVSALYRFPIGSGGKLSGYVGPGYLYLQEVDIDFDNDEQQEISFETDDGGFQFKLGGRYDVSERWFVEAGATYFAGGEITMELPADTNQTLSADYDHWTMSLGAGLRF